MTAKFWTKTGEDIWTLEEKRVFDFKNLETGETVTCEGTTNVLLSDFVPVIMPKAKKKTPPAPSTKRSAEKPTSAKKKTASRRGAKSKYKGVSPSRTSGKFRAQFCDKKKIKHLGTFESELLAAAAVQEALGNHEEAKRLRNEYEEGDRRPETTPSEQ